MILWRRIFLAIAILSATPSFADDNPFDPKPWLGDLAQMHAAMGTNYANLEWAVFDRGADLDDYFDRAAKRISKAQDAGSAKAAFDGLIRRLGDGHVAIDWPAPPSGPQASGTHDVCAETGFNSAKAAAPLAALAPGYAPLKTAQSDMFPAGTITVGRQRVGVLKIALFSSEAFPALCRKALTALSLAPDAPCTDACSDKVSRWTDARMTQDFIAQIEALKRARIDALVVDVAGNGGGSEWAEAAARMLSAKRLVSERMAFVRGPQWAKEFGDAETALRDAAKTATPEDREFLLTLADAAKTKRAAAGAPCDSAPLWKGRHPSCAWLGDGFYASGLIAAADPRTLRGKSWAATVFTPMEYPYREGVWRGPLIVLVDGESWSASEEFAALLQDNRAAFVMGEPTGGAGCGHTDGSQPTVLTNSGGRLELPDCARLRRDGSNEVRGVIPGLILGWGHHDGPRQRAAAFLKALPKAVLRAEMTGRHKS
jgi:hypothetical protein